MAVALDDGATRQLTHFEDDGSGRAIANYAWSSDGARLVRATSINDVVLVRGLR